MSASNWYFHLASSAQGVPLEGAESEPDLSDSLSGSKRGHPLMGHLSQRRHKEPAPTCFDRKCPEAVGAQFRDGHVARVARLALSSEPAALGGHVCAMGMSSHSVSESHVIFRQIKTGCVAAFLLKQFFSHPPCCHLGKYEWTWASTESLHVWLPRDASEIEA